MLYLYCLKMNGVVVSCGVYLQVALAKMVTSYFTEAERAAATRQIYFTLFQGEQFDNIGSSAFFNQLMNEKFPDGTAAIAPTRVTEFIELSHLGRQATTYIHQPSGVYMFAMVLKTGYDPFAL